MSKSTGIKWDEDNIAKNDEESLAANRTKILEPKTPFHELLDDGETPDPRVPKAAGAVAGGKVHGDEVAPGMDLAALAAAAEGRRADGPEDDEEERARKFEEHRKGHYKIGSLAELRAQVRGDRPACSATLSPPASRSPLISISLTPPSSSFLSYSSNRPLPWTTTRTRTSRLDEGARSARQALASDEPELASVWKKLRCTVAVSSCSLPLFG